MLYLEIASFKLVSSYFINKGAELQLFGRNMSGLFM